MSEILIDSKNYFEDVLSEIRKAERRIFIQSMLFEFDDKFKDIVEALKAANLRGVKVNLIIDGYSYMTTQSHNNLYPILNSKTRKFYSEYKEKNYKYINELKAAGINVEYINLPKNLISKVFHTVGRNHTKLTIIGDIFYLGGTSFASVFSGILDFMVKSDDSKSLDIIYDVFINLNNNKYNKDFSIKLNEFNTLFVDVGKVGKSIIYDEALNLINTAQRSIKYTSQMLPIGDIQSALKKAKARGVEVQIMIHDPKHAGVNKNTNSIDHLIFKAGNIQEPKLKIALYQKSYIHAKLIEIDDSVAIYGSNNYSRTGVIMGTEEVAIVTRNKTIITAFSSWYDNAFSHTKAL